MFVCNLSVCGLFFFLHKEEEFAKRIAGALRRNGDLNGSKETESWIMDHGILRGLIMYSQGHVIQGKS